MMKNKKNTQLGKYLTYHLKVKILLLLPVTQATMTNNIGVMVLHYLTFMMIYMVIELNFRHEHATFLLMTTKLISKKRAILV